LGIIRKQSIIGSLFLYLGVFIGFITTSVLFPRILHKEEIGLLNTLVAYSIVFAQLGTLGFNIVIIKVFPYFKDSKNNHNGFFFITLCVTVIGFFVTLIIFYLVKSYIIKQNIQNSPLFTKEIYLLLPLILFTIIFYNFDTYYSALLRSIRGLFLKEFLQRMLILAGLILYYLGLLNIKSFVLSYVAAVCLPAVFLIFWLIYDGEFVVKPQLGFITKELRRKMLSVGFFGILAVISGNIITQIDIGMASSMINLKATGIYSTVLIYAALIKLPSRAVLKVSMPIVSEAWKRNDLEEIKKVYKSSSLNQFLIAIFCFIGVWANIDNVLRILPDGFEAGKYIILLLGVASVIEMAAGTHATIIMMSPKYQYLTWFSLFILVLVILLNFLFVPTWQIIGVAMASALANIVFTFTKMGFVYIKFKMQPFDYKFLIIIGLSLFTFFISYLIPYLNNLYLDILIRSSVITIIFGFSVLSLKISPDVNHVFNNLILRFKK
jgi:O-antigen/teichoic acid export membrane protein